MILRMFWRVIFYRGLRSLEWGDRVPEEGGAAGRLRLLRLQKGDFQISQITELLLNESEVELENTEKEDQSNSEKIRNGSVKGIVL